MNRILKSVSLFSEGYACSQAIVTEFGKEFGLNHDHAMQLTSGFAGGMRTGKTCGAVTGAIMILGLKHSKSNCDVPAGRKDVYLAVDEFLKRFKNIYKTVLCLDLIGCDISTEEGMQLAKSKKVFRTVCPGIVQYTAEILEKMLNESTYPF